MRCAHICAVMLHIMMKLNPETKLRYYTKNADGIARNTTKSMATGLSHYAHTDFMSERARERIERLKRRRRDIAGAAVGRLHEQCHSSFAHV